MWKKEVDVRTTARRKDVHVVIRQSSKAKRPLAKTEQSNGLSPDASDSSYARGSAFKARARGDGTSEHSSKVIMERTQIPKADVQVNRA
ncbi:hypothetical protein R1flu_014544 [Riccia fluitans]|uniref:Uncharacterized protein n=1 Tax=Riccia fluitans TaxID=41844 RepID=A0ABD1YGS6_9MARC